MASTIVLIASGNLMRSSISSSSSDQFSSVHRLVTSSNKNTSSAVSFRGHPQHHHNISTSGHQARRDFSVYCLQPGNHLPDSPGLWQQWIFGIIATVIVPLFFTRKWNNLSKIKDKVDTVVEETEKIVDYVEEVAETVDKVAKDVADHLPQGGKWRNAAVFVEGVAEEIAKDAHLVEDYLHEVEEVEEKVELLVESVEDQTKNLPKHITRS